MLMLAGLLQSLFSPYTHLYSIDVCMYMHTICPGHGLYLCKLYVSIHTYMLM